MAVSVESGAPVLEVSSEPKGVQWSPWSRGRQENN